MNKTVVITGGGTGGHLKVADAFIEEFHNKGINVIFILKIYVFSYSIKMADLDFVTNGFIKFLKVNTFNLNVKFFINYGLYLIILRLSVTTRNFWT